MESPTFNLNRAQKQGTKPIMHSLRDMYAYYAKGLLKAHPDYKFIKGKKVKGRYIEISAVYRIGPNGGNEKVMTYELFKRIMHCYYKKAQEAIIAGKVVNMLNGVGYIQAVRVERDHKKKAVDWQSSHELNERNPENGKLKLVFFTDDDWCRVGWQKHGRLNNETAYEFVPSETGSTDKGFKNQFVKALKSNPLLKFQYKYCPRIVDAKTKQYHFLKQAA